MRRARLTWRVVAGIGVLLLVCGTATVWAGDGPKTKQLHLLIKVTATTAVDVDGSGGASVGDTLIEQGDLYTGLSDSLCTHGAKKGASCPIGSLRCRRFRMS